MIAQAGVADAFCVQSIDSVLTLPEALSVLAPGGVQRIVV
jgi:hypothetical protein